MLNFVHHAHYVVRDTDAMVANIHQVARDLAGRGNKLRGQGGVIQIPRGYLSVNIELASSQGLWFQLSEG